MKELKKYNNHKMRKCQRIVNLLSARGIKCKDMHTAFYYMEDGEFDKIQNMSDKKFEKLFDETMKYTKLLNKLPQPKTCFKCGKKVIKSNLGCVGLSPDKKKLVGVCLECE
jgi:hypothetical protein